LDKHLLSAWDAFAAPVGHAKLKAQIRDAPGSIGDGLFNLLVRNVGADADDHGQYLRLS
jgi:hypothetical protein